MGLATAILRGARGRCPTCGEGRFRPVRDADGACSECDRPFLNDPGDWTGAAEIVLIITVATGAMAFHLAGAAAVATPLRYGIAMAVALLTVLLIYPRVRGAWVGLVQCWEGADPQQWPEDYDAEWPPPRDDDPWS